MEGRYSILLNEMNWIRRTTGLAWCSLAAMASLQAGLFKIDFGGIENDPRPLDENGQPIGPAPAPLADWDVIPTWTFASRPGDLGVWRLRDFSNDGDADVTLTFQDDRAGAKALDPENPPYATGMNANNVGRPEVEEVVVHDGIVIPNAVRDDYLWRDPDRAGTRMFFRFAGLDAGRYAVTVFEGRITDSSQYGKIWVDGPEVTREPAEQNTGNFAGSDSGEALPMGQPRTVEVNVQPGDYLWYAHLEDGTGGISGMIIRRLETVAQPVLVGAPTIGGPFTPVPGATLDPAARTITVPQPAGPFFYRVAGYPGSVSIAVNGPNLVIRMP